MKFTLLFTIILLSGKQSSTVYICASPDAKKYHYSENCRGLNACAHEVKKMSLSDAKKSGKEICGWED